MNELLDHMRRGRELRAEAWSSSARNLPFLVRDETAYDSLQGVDLSGFGEGTVVGDLAALMSENESTKRALAEVAGEQPGSETPSSLAQRLSKMLSPKGMIVELDRRRASFARMGVFCRASFEQRDGCDRVALTLDCGQAGVFFRSVLEARLAGLSKLMGYPVKDSVAQPAMRSFLRAAQSLDFGEAEIFRRKAASEFDLLLNGEVDMAHVWKTMRLEPVGAEPEEVEGGRMLSVADF